MREAMFRKGLVYLHRLGLSFDAWMYHTQILEPDMAIPFQLSSCSKNSMYRYSICSPSFLCHIFAFTQ